MAHAASRIASKTSVPSTYRTADWDRVPAWIRERAYFMAAVDQADLLAAFRREATAIAAGEKTLAQARETMRRHLSAVGYEPDEDKAGTIEDLSTRVRQDVSLSTNADMARGWAQRAQFTGDIAFPGLLLYRAQQRREKRDWGARCNQFAGRDDVVLLGDPDAPMVALSNSPVWSMLSRFGTPYPPFDFNSGMWTKPVSYDECVRYGLITADNEDEMLDRVMNNPKGSLNADLAVDRVDWDDEVVADVLEQLGGLAEWDDGQLIARDPNGTRPYNSRDIGSVITAPLPAGLPHIQADALRKSRTAPDEMTREDQDDLARLYERIEPANSTEGGPIYRGLSLADDELDAIRRDGYRAREDHPGDAWATSREAAAKYARRGDGLNPVILAGTAYQSARMLADCLREVMGEDVEGEAATLPGQTFRVLNEHVDADGVITLEVQEETRG